MKQNNPSYLFGMYEPDTDSVIVNAINDTYTNSPLTISCEKCNSTIFLDTPDDIAYLYRLAQESPLLYAELACKPNGLQEYVNAMNWFIPIFFTHPDIPLFPDLDFPPSLFGLSGTNVHIDM